MTRTASLRQRAGVISILLGLLMSLLTVVSAPPAFAETACDGDANSTDAQRVFLEFGGTTDGTYDGTDFLDSEVDPCTEEGGNDITFDAYPDVIIHVSCSADLNGTVFPGLGTVTDYWVNSVNNGENTAGSCQPLDTFPDPEPDPEPTATLACEEVESDQFAISYTLDKDGSTDQFDLTGPSGASDLDETDTLTEIVSDAANGEYAISGTDATLTVDGDCELLPEQDPDVDLQLTSMCTATLGTQVYELYINGEQGFANLEVSDGMGVMRVTNTGTDSSTVSFNVTATPLGDADFTIDPGEYSFFEVPADTTIIITDVNGDTDTKAQNGDPCDTPPGLDVRVIKVFTDQAGDFLAEQITPPTFLVELFDGADASGEAVAFDSNEASFEDNVGPITGEQYTVTETVDGWSAVECSESVLSEYRAFADGLGTFDLAFDESPQFVPTQLNNDFIDVLPQLTLTHVVCNAEDPLPTPEIELVKTATLVDGEPLLADDAGDKVLPTFEGLDAAPQTVTYEYEVTNTGEVTLTDLDLVDDRLGAIDGTAGVVLEPGESETFTGTETFTVEDAQDPGTITNLGTVEGDALIDDETVTVSDTDDETVLMEFVLDVVELAPSIDLVKTALVEPDADGVKVVTYDGTDDDEETVTYEYLITNTGETELVDVTLVDDILGTILDASDGVSLAPGESTTVEAVHVLTEADANAGEVLNVAVTTGTPPEGEDVTATDDEVVEVMEVLDDVVEEDDPEVLSATGFGTTSGLATGLAMILGGLALVMTGRRRETA